MYYFVLLHKHLTNRKKPSPFIHQKESALPFIHLFMSALLGWINLLLLIIFHASLFERNNINIELDISSLAQPQHKNNAAFILFFSWETLEVGTKINKRNNPCFPKPCLLIYQATCKVTGSPIGAHSIFLCCWNSSYCDRNFR